MTILTSQTVSLQVNKAKDHASQLLSSEWSAVKRNHEIIAITSRGYPKITFGSKRIWSNGELYRFLLPPVQSLLNIGSRWLGVRDGDSSKDMPQDAEYNYTSESSLLLFGKFGKLFVRTRKCESFQTCDVPKWKRCS